ncbi:thiamine-phosphate kinase [Alkalihalobacillus sp. AL-G]|uniref:thiamine-phosphate kinase n=1 Tax=Alkalihalobacillus sp. AL-G TaxID=2926399 RepID=UPI00272D8070|nr:thiamine-phosphate kinase [Alkalihalobacillus sp. AL-G]WLD93686.1 thiamine-phosphate kinase [Alkalihalobacillus sp. AL-G]
MKDEFDFIDSITPKKSFQPTLIRGIGDDAALIRSEAGQNDILCVDTMVESIHFNRKTMNPYQIGYKALAVNVSDIAAMGGAPTFYLVSIAIPSSWSEEELQEIYKGMDGLAQQHEMDLIGGDTVSTKGPLVISVTVHGRVQSDRQLLRENARPGDIVFVTGPLGLSAAGLHLLLENDQFEATRQKELLKAHQMPDPQVKAGLLLAESGFRIALNDISDGIASEAWEIADASQVHITLDYDQVPKHPELKHFSAQQTEEWILYGGEDFQLVGTVSESNWLPLKRLFDQHQKPLYNIGTVETGEAGVSLFKNGDSLRLSKKGYNHFKGNSKS